jgi:hypothetical protein
MSRSDSVVSAPYSRPEVLGLYGLKRSVHVERTESSVLCPTSDGLAGLFQDGDLCLCNSESALPAH